MNMLNLVILWWSLLLISIITVNGFYIKNDNNSNENLDFQNIIKSWSKLKSKLQLSNNFEDSDLLNDSNEETFNELEVLQLIPSIIDQYRTNKLSDHDQLILKEIYGNLWSIMCQEADRSIHDEINPMLSALLQSFHFTDSTSKINNNNDIENNSVQHKHHQLSKKSSKNKLLLNINKDDHPSQRVLNTAAMLIHQVMNSKDSSDIKKQQTTETLPFNTKLAKHRHRLHSNSIAQESVASSLLLPSSPHKRNKPRTATLNLRLTNIPINQITRSKRNIEIRVNGNEMSSTKIDALLKMFRENHGLSSNEINDEDEDDQDDDDGDDDEDLIQNNYLKMNSELKDKDYWYDDLYEDDEEAVSSRNPDPDYGSFQDLILLATKHRLTREQEEHYVNKPKNGRQFFSD